MKTKKEEIVEAIKSCKEKGIQIVREEWGVEINEDKGYYVPEHRYGAENGAVCALGALLVYKNGNINFSEYGINIKNLPDPEEVAACVLSVDKQWVNCFIVGFDHCAESHKWAGCENLIPELGLYRDPDGITEFVFVTDLSNRVVSNREAYNIGREIGLEFSQDGINEQEDD